LLFAQVSDGEGAVGVLGLVVFIILGVAFYFIPTIVAFVKGVPNKMSVAILNFFLGWTFIGWVVALAMAFRDRPAPQQVVVYNQPPTAQAPPAAPPPLQSTTETQPDEGTP